MENSGRNIVLCFDGTTNRFGRNRITNVIRLFEILEKGSENQICYYQTGIGTYDINAPFDSQNSSLRSRISRTTDAAFANGIKKHVLGGYRFLMEKYKQGDIIYMFGFSRGAYTARVLCGMLDKVGLLISGNEEQIAFAWNMYQGAAKHIQVKGVDKSLEKDIVTVKSEPLTHGFRAIFGRRVTVHFLGLWDTVQSTGFLRTSQLSEASDGFVEQVYHALALNERRHKFQPLFYGNVVSNEAESQGIHLRNSTHSDTRKTIVHEVWFAGDHSDVGGRFDYQMRSEPSLANLPFRWIVSAAAMSSPGRGLLFDCHALLKYYKILFLDMPAAYAHYPLPKSAWFCQDYTTVASPGGKWPDLEKLDFLCIFGHHFLTHHGETMSHANDIAQDTNRILARNCGWNIWSILQILALKHPFGHARQVHNNTELHFSVLHKIQSDSNYNREIRHDNAKPVSKRLLHETESTQKMHVGFYTHTHIKNEDQRIYVSFTAPNADRVIQELSNLVQDLEDDLKELMAATQSVNISLQKQLQTANTKQRSEEELHITMLDYDKKSNQILKDIISLQINLGVWYRIRMESTGSLDDLYKALESNERAIELLDGLSKSFKHGLDHNTEEIYHEKELSRNSEDTGITDRDLHDLQVICMSNYARLNLVLYEHNSEAGLLDTALESTFQAERILKEAGRWNDRVTAIQKPELNQWKSSSDKSSTVTAVLVKDFYGELQAKLFCNLAETCVKKYEIHNTSSFLDHAIQFQEQALGLPDVALRNVPIRQYKLCTYYAARVEHYRKEMSDLSSEASQNIQKQIQHDLHRVSELNREALKSLAARNDDPMQPTRHYSEIVELFHGNYHTMFGNSMASHMNPALQTELDRLLGFSIPENYSNSSTAIKLVDFGKFSLDIKDILALPDVIDAERHRATLMTLSNLGAERHLSSFKLSELSYRQYLRAPFDLKHINDTILFQNNALSHILGSKDDAKHLYDLGRFYLARIIFSSRDDIEEADVAEAITKFETGLSLQDGNEDIRMENLELVELFFIRWDRTGNVNDLDDAIYRLKIALSSSDFEIRSKCLSRLGDILMKRIKHFGRKKDVDAAKVLKLLLEHDSSDKERFQEVLDTIEGQTSSSSPPDMILTLQESLQSTTETEPLISIHRELSHFWLICFKQYGSNDALNKCISSANELIQESLTPLDDLRRPNYLVNLAKLLYIRFQRFGNLTDLKMAISRCEAAGGVIGPSSTDTHVGNIKHSFILGNLYQSKFYKTREASDIDKAISIYEFVASSAPNGILLKASVLNKLGSAYLSRFDLREHSLDDLQKSIDAHSRAVASTSNTDPKKQQFLSDLAISRLRRSLRLLDAAECAGAIADLKEALDLSSDDNKLQYTAELALAYIGRFMIQRDTEIIGEAISITERVTTHYIPCDRPDIYVFYGQLRDLFSVARRYYNDDDTSDRDQAEMIGRMKGYMEIFFTARASYCSKTRYSFAKCSFDLKILMDVDIDIITKRDLLASTKDVERFQLLADLSLCLVKRFDYLEDLTDLDEAIMFQNTVLQNATDYRLRKLTLRDIGRSYYKRYEMIGDTNDIKAAVLAQTDSVHFDAGSNSYNEVLQDLGFSLLQQFESSGIESDLKAVIFLRELIVQNCPDEEKKKSAYLHDFGYAMFRRYEKFGSLEDISEAIAVQREVIQRLDDDSLQKSHHINALRIYEQNLLEPDSLELEREVQEEVVSMSGNGLVGEDQQRIRFNPQLEMISNFVSNIRREVQACFWLICFKQYGSNDALNKCISSANELIQESFTPLDDLRRPNYLVNLAKLLYIRFQRFGNLADLNLAISHCEEATDGAIDTKAPNTRVVNLKHHFIMGKLYQHKFYKTRDASNIDKAISFYEVVASSAPNGILLKAMFWNRLGSAYLARFDLREHSLDDLQKSIDAHSKAVALTSSTDTRKQEFLSDLAISRLRRCLRLLDVAECSEAIVNLKKALDLASDDIKLQYTVESAVS